MAHIRSEITALLEGLSDRHLACLQGVLDHKSSKQIGRELGISPHTVDARIRHCLRHLNVQNRREAAALLLQENGTYPYQSPIYQSPSLHDRPEFEQTSQVQRPHSRDVIYTISDEVGLERNGNILHDSVTVETENWKKEGMQSCYRLEKQNKLDTIARIIAIIIISLVSFSSLAIIVMGIGALKTFYS